MDGETAPAGSPIGEFRLRVSILNRSIHRMALKRLENDFHIFGILSKKICK